MSTQLPPLVGIGGLKESGKDTVADIWVRDFGFKKVFMSDPLNEILLATDPWVTIPEGWLPHRWYERVFMWLAKLFRRGWTAHDFLRYSEVIARWGYTKAKEIPEVRRLLMKIGTEGGREVIGEDVWVEVARKKIQALRAEGHPVVITGIRYENELLMIEDEGGISLWVDRPSLAENIGLRVIDAITEELQNHSSERTLSKGDFDMHLINDSDLVALEVKATDMAMDMGINPK